MCYSLSIELVNPLKQFTTLFLLLIFTLYFTTTIFYFGYLSPSISHKMGIEGLPKKVVLMEVKLFISTIYYNNVI